MQIYHQTKARLSFKVSFQIVYVKKNHIKLVGKHQVMSVSPQYTKTLILLNSAINNEHNV